MDKPAYIIIHNGIDKTILLIVSFVFIFLYSGWFLVNAFALGNNRLIWFVNLILSFLLTAILVKKYKIETKKITKKEAVAFLIFMLLSGAVLLFFLEPVIRFPASTVGIPNKDLHDGIAAFISQYGYAPAEAAHSDKADFILNANGGLYLGYPNVLHVLSAFFNKIGVSVFHATWVAASGMILLDSLALYLLLKHFFKDPYYAAILAGLFGVSTMRIPYAMVTSLPMFFSFSLIIPALLLLFVSVHQLRGKLSSLLPSVAFSLVAASYSGTIFVLLSVFLVYAGILLALKMNREAGIVLKILVAGLPLLILTLLFQYPIYWRNTFATKLDFDPSELSQQLWPAESFLYFLFLIVSLISYIALAFKERAYSREKAIGHLIFFVNAGLVLLLVYELFFYRVNQISSWTQIQGVNVDGFFGGLNHQKIARLALLQPYFFIFPVGYFFYRFFPPKLRLIFVTVLLLVNFVIKAPGQPYSLIRNDDLRKYFYNGRDSGKPFTLLSDIRLILNKELWTAPMLAVLDDLKKLKTPTEKILILDSRGWSEQSLVNWSSIYLLGKIYGANDIKADLNRFSPTSLTNIPTDIDYVFFLFPSEETVSFVKSRLFWPEIYHRGSLVVYKRLKK
ncbi:hypothetical protein HY214_04105 [Candidatus Roizmanbacteria bacterium]|nr:hypothetical protein [Candidatus Roizmanbacteria bacterium]